MGLQQIHNAIQLPGAVKPVAMSMRKGLHVRPNMLPNHAKVKSNQLTPDHGITDPDTSAPSSLTLHRDRLGHFVLDYGSHSLVLQGNQLHDNRAMDPVTDIGIPTHVPTSLNEDSVPTGDLRGSDVTLSPSMDNFTLEIPCVLILLLCLLCPQHFLSPSVISESDLNRHKKIHTKRKTSKYVMIIM
ncbi:Hypothetical predicted protein [Octopus vulgaris]|uniref:Uncharacterized protein n=1 Tax=Octopus vulgaris TaxID=6645 RepID=A0AA36BY63_OCTVU|nr:Hypothetical predicted protein [Octopus vulgaris]